MERRVLTATGIEVRAKAGEPTRIGGYAAKFFRSDDPGTEYPLWEGGPVERILPGSFSRAVKEDDVRALWNHKAESILGRTTSGTLRLREDDVGLFYEIDLDDTQVAQDLAKSIARGDVNQSSFAFSITDEAWRTENEQEIREIRGVKLYDVSPVTYPAYASATVGMRAHGECPEARASHENYVKTKATTTKQQAEARLRVIHTDDAKYAEVA